MPNKTEGKYLFGNQKVAKPSQIYAYVNMKQSTSLFDKEIESVVLQNQSIEENPLSNHSDE